MSEYGVRTDMLSLDGWLKVRTTKKDSQCLDCKTPYIDIGESISLVFIPGKPNRHTCKQCALKHIAKGAADYTKQIEEANMNKQELIDKIMAVPGHNYTTTHTHSYNEYNNLTLKDVSKLETILVEVLEAKAKQDEIDADVAKYVDVPTEPYLKEEYGVYEDRVYLQSPLQIEQYFLDNGADHLKCGQGYAEFDTDVLVKIGDRFYKVHIEAEIGSAKQDRGDRLYWVENVRHVTYEEVPKPCPKAREDKTYNLKNLSVDDISAIDSLLKSRGIENS
jgi:hypothetical protein